MNAAPASFVVEDELADDSFRRLYLTVRPPTMLPTTSLAAAS